MNRTKLWQGWDWGKNLVPCRALVGEIKLEELELTESESHRAELWHNYRGGGRGGHPPWLHPGIEKVYIFIHGI